MQRTLILAITIALGLGVAISAQAQTASSTSARRPHNASTETQRDVNQQTRIQNGLESGQLTTREAGKLERGQQVINKTEQRAMRDGLLSVSDRVKIQRRQNAQNKYIYSQKHDARTGDPDSTSSKRMQANVQRNVKQQQRIHNGVANGSLTNREAARMEGRQANSDRKQARAARNGRVGMREQVRIRYGSNRNSHRIHFQKHDRQRRH